MQTKHIGMVRALAFGLPLAMTLTFVACGDDSSSGVNNSGSEGDIDDVFADIKADGCNFKKDDKVWKYTFTLKQQGIDSDAARYVEYNGDKTRDSVVAVSTGSQTSQACKFMTGKETDEQEEDGIKVITSAWCEGSTFYSDEVRVGDFKGMSRSEAFDMVMKECEVLNNAANGDYSSSGKGSKSSSSGKSDGKSSSSSKSEPQYENPFTDLKVGECNFKIDDKTWQYVTYSDNFGLGDAYELHYYQYKDGGSIDSTYTYTFGSSARTLCRLDGDKDTSYTNNYGAKVHFKSWCTSDGMEEFEILKNTDQDKSREDAFREFMTWCKALNDVSDESSSSTEGDDVSSSSNKYGESCKAKIDDNVWYADDGEGKSYVIFEWKGSKVKISSTQVTEMGTASACENMLKYTTPCTGDSCTLTMTCDGSKYLVTTLSTSELERDYAFNHYQSTYCGVVPASSSSAKSSSSSAKSSSSSAKSSSSSAKSSSSQKTEPTYPTNYGKSCEFKKDDNTWYVENKDSKYYEVYEWTGNKAKETSVTFVDMDEPQTCETMKGLLPDCSTESNSCTCDNELLIVKMTIQKEFSSKADAYAEIMFNVCGIEVEIESSSSEAEEESSSSAAVNHCSFEKTDAEWTFVSEDVTEIYTWDSNDQYVFTHISKIAFDGDDFYEGCEDCKTAQQYCEEDAAGAILEDEDYTYTYTCDEGVMTTTSVSKDKYGDSDEREAIFVDRCLYEE
jgi:hypothetical protein